MILDSISQLCELHSTTFAQLEKELGFGNGTIRRWSESSPSTDKLLKVADHFGVTIDFIVRGKGDVKSALNLQISKIIDSLPKDKQILVFQYVKLLAEKAEVS